MIKWIKYIYGAALLVRRTGCADGASLRPESAVLRTRYQRLRIRIDAQFDAVRFGVHEQRIHLLQHDLGALAALGRPVVAVSPGTGIIVQGNHFRVCRSLRMISSS